MTSERREETPSSFRVPRVPTASSGSGDPITAAAHAAADQAPPMSDELKRRVTELLRTPGARKEAS